MTAHRTPMTRGERLAYQRGYNTQISRSNVRMQRICRLAESWREKARDNSLHGARCDSCLFWRRGGPNIKWGFCSQDWEATPSLGAAWTDWNGAQERAALISHENFACINWAKRND